MHYDFECVIIGYLNHIKTSHTSILHITKHMTLSIIIEHLHASEHILITF